MTTPIRRITLLQGVASAAVSAVTGYGPYRDYNRNYNWFDNLTKVSGKHTIKTGITIVHYNK